VGVDCSMKLQSACNGGEGAPTLTQREHLGVQIEAHRSLPSRGSVSFGRRRAPLGRPWADVPRHGSFRLGREGRSGRTARRSRQEPFELHLNPILALRTLADGAAHRQVLGDAAPLCARLRTVCRGRHERGRTGPKRLWPDSDKDKRLRSDPADSGISRTGHASLDRRHSNPTRRGRRSLGGSYERQSALGHADLQPFSLIKGSWRCPLAAGWRSSSVTTRSAANSEMLGCRPSWTSRRARLLKVWMRRSLAWTGSRMARLAGPDRAGSGVSLCHQVRRPRATGLRDRGARTEEHWDSVKWRACWRHPGPAGQDGRDCPRVATPLAPRP
jgi:hypothetical protein